MQRLMTVRMWLALAVLVLAGCNGTIGPFTQRAYEQATSLKVEALTLMDKAIHPYAEHKTEVDALRLNIDKAYEYARGLPKNKVSTEQWQILRDPGRNSIGGFLKRWETKGQLLPAFIEEAKPIVAKGFDMIIELESGKQKPDSTPGK